MYAQETKQADEISIFPCDGLEIILTEKFLSLLRRTAEIDRRGSPDDEALIRHECSTIRQWRPQGDSNPCYRRERAMS